MSLDSIDYNEPSLDVREFLSLGDEFSPRGGGLGSDPESLLLDGVSSYEAIISVRLLCLSDSLRRCCSPNKLGEVTLSLVSNSSKV
jgi:hypothetical protein